MTSDMRMSRRSALKAGAALAAGTAAGDGLSGPPWPTMFAASTASRQSIRRAAFSSKAAPSSAWTPRSAIW